eukprot:5063330-Prymnesium_polylepis.1
MALADAALAERSAPVLSTGGRAASRPTSAGVAADRPSAVGAAAVERPGSAAARLTTVDAGSLRTVQSAAALQREHRRAATVAAAVKASRPSSANSGMQRTAAERASIEAAATRAAVYNPSTVVSAVPSDKRQSSRLPMYTGHLLPPADRDSAFTYVDAKPPPAPAESNPFDPSDRKWQMGYWEQQLFPTHSTQPRKEQYDALSETLTRTLEELKVEQSAANLPLPERLAREREVYGIITEELARQGRTENKRRTEVMERVIGRAWEICDELLPLVVRLSTRRLEMQAARDVVLAELPLMEEAMLEYRKDAARMVLETG